MSGAREALANSVPHGDGPGAVPVPADSPGLSRRVAVALAVAIAAGAIAAVKTRVDLHGFEVDLGYFQSAARVLLDGGNPYASAVFVYPLTAVLAMVPFARLPLPWAAVLVVGLSMGCAAFALTRDGYWRLPMLMSFPALVAMSSGQWAPLVMCAALGSAYGWTAALKPTLGIAMLARRVDWRGAALAAVVLLLSLVVLPTWPAQWAATIWAYSGAKIHHIPVTIPGGVLLLLAALRWRTADGRLLLAMAVVPQSMFFYDQLALGLLARSFRQVLLCSLWSYVVMGAAYLAAPPNLDTLAQNAGFLSRAIVWGYYLPALVVVLRRPNVPARLSTEVS